MNKEYRLLIKSKKVKTANGQSFVKFFTDVNIEVEGEEDVGMQRKAITVKFAKEVDVSKIKRGIVTCNAENIDLPYKYRIVKDEKTGKDKYPIVFVKKIDKYEEKPLKSNVTFVLDDEEEDSEATPIEDAE